MPVYNGERFIARAVETALASTFTDFELLVVDDGSTDGSLAEARRAARGDARVRLMPVPHGGVAAARNAAVNAARGEFIANLDSDDEMLPRRLERQVAYLDAHPECVVVGCRSVVIDGDGKPLTVKGRYFTHEAIDGALLDGDGGAMVNDTAMFRSSALQAVGGYAGHLTTTGEDHDLSLRLAEVGRLAVLPDVLNRYRVHGTNISLGTGSAERRLPITLATLARAFERRGIRDREPAKLKPPPFSRGERWRDEAYLQLFRGKRLRASLFGVGTLLLGPGDPSRRAVLRALVNGAE
jgi:glycosyltransferase involved in cell wall biosynthesis